MKFATKKKKWTEKDSRKQAKGSVHSKCLRDMEKWAQLNLGKARGDEVPPVATACDSFGLRSVLNSKKTTQFTYIVDLDAYDYHKIVFLSFVKDILSNAFFRFGILLLVVVNSITIGLGTSEYLNARYSVLFAILDQVILSVFVFEIMLKWLYDFRMFWKVTWNILDFLMVFVITLSATVPIFGISTNALGIVRVARAFRSLRTVSSLTSLSIVAQTVFKSGVDMANILLVLQIFMIVMAIMGVILFEINELDTRRFLNALDAWVVLFICVTQDGWVEVLDEFRKQNHFELVAIYLMLAVSIGSFVFANLIVAVICANLEYAVRDFRNYRILLENPLDLTFVSRWGVPILPCMDQISSKVLTLRRQKPMEIPPLRNISRRRISNYVNLVVALEQNMIEAAILKHDLDRVIAVFICLALQLEGMIDCLDKQEEIDPRMDSIMNKLHAINKLDVIPRDTYERAEALQQLRVNRTRRLSKAMTAARLSRSNLFIENM